MSAETSTPYYGFHLDPRVLIVLPPLLGPKRAADLVVEHAGDVRGRTVVVDQRRNHVVSRHFMDQFILRLLKVGALEIVFAGHNDDTTPVVEASIARLGVGDRVRLGEMDDLVGLQDPYSRFYRTTS